jgi:hypothetical protein
VRTLPYTSGAKNCARSDIEAVLTLSVVGDERVQRLLGLFRYFSQFNNHSDLLSFTKC